MRKLSPRYTINLPALPSSWNRLSSAELEEIWQMTIERNMAVSSEGEEVAHRKYKLKVFLYLLGLKIRKRTVKDEKGEMIYLFRRKGLRHLWENIPMRAWQIDQWINSRLKFLDNPLQRTVSPYTYIHLRHGLLKLKCPDTYMSDVTFRQYLAAQNTLTSCWDAQKLLETLVNSKKEISRKALVEQINRVKMCRRRFLATLFNPSVMKTGEIRDGKFVSTVKRQVCAFDMEQIDMNERFFSSVEERMYPVMEQFFQSVQVYYSELFPNLYASSGQSMKKQNMIKIEVAMINNVMKYQGFSDYDRVYDSEALRILGIMEKMCKEAKEIEETRQRMNRKS